ncbi:Ig-like domain-containing protein [Vibrio alfacsensis]|uniref:Ig-like domain-containing protein n=1 Tax=Vibrio alfacsensis TaxID=1074311 RepID=UPI004068F320
MTLNHIYRSSRVLMLMFGLSSALFGCGGEGDGSESTTPQPPPVIDPEPESGPLTALSGLAPVRINEPTWVDLSPFILGQHSSSVISVEPPESLNCPSPNVKGAGFEVTFTEAAWCDYRYTVSNGARNNNSAEATDQASGTMTLVTSTATDPVLDPISVATIEGTQRIEIELKNASGLDGYGLLASSVKVHATAGMAKGTILVSPAGYILYDAPDQFGWNYIQYALTKTLPDNSVDTRIGYVFVTIADGINTPPSISPSHWHYPVSLLPEVELEIDLSNQASLTITDFHHGEASDWQLHDVKSMGATVNKHATNNKAFTFRAAEEGEYDVSYIISDFDGGYSMGIMKITVAEPVPTPDWDAITRDFLHDYSAPLTASQASQEEAWGNAQLTENLAGRDFDIALWTPDQANNYCASLGRRLPTSEEMTALNQSVDAAVVAERNKWPRAMSYFINDGSLETPDYGAMALQANSQVTSVNSASQRYVTCYQKRLATLRTNLFYPHQNNTGVYAGLEYGDDLGITVSLSSQVLDRSNSGITITTSDPNTVICPTPTDAGTAYCQYKPRTEARMYPVTFTAELGLGSDNPTTIANINVIANMERVRLETEQPDYDLNVGIPKQITVSQADEFGNPVAGMAASIEDSLPNDISWTMALSQPARIVSMLSPRVDLSGASSATIDVTADKAGSATLKLTSQLAGVTEVTAGLQVMLAPSIGICGGAINDDDKFNATGKCLKVATDNSGNWFTSTPSQAVMNELHYSITPGGTGRNYVGIHHTGKANDGPEDASFAMFDQLGGDTEGNGGQYDRWCKNLAAMNFAGTDKWQRATLHQLDVLIADNSVPGSISDGMWNYHGWPAGMPYWSNTKSSDNSDFGHHTLHAQTQGYDSAGKPLYASCVAVSPQ